MGDLEVRKEEVKANYKRQILSELQDTSQRLLNIDATLGTARQVRHLRAQEIEFSGEEYAVRVTRTRSDNVTAFNATEDTKLEPGDVIEIKRIQNELESSHPTEAALSQQNLRQEFVPVEQQPTFASFCSETAGASTDSKSNTQPGNSGDDKQVSDSGNNSATAEEQQATASERIAGTDLVAPPWISSAEIKFNSQPGNAENDEQLSASGLFAAADGQEATAASVAPTTKPKTPPLISAGAEIKKAAKVTSRGAAVKAIQHALRDLGYSLTVDGVIGPITMGAIQDALANVKNQSAQRPADGLGGANLLASGMQQ
jgi:hypothetical protein